MKKNRYSVIFLTLLIGIGVILSVANYSPQTWLSGWDTLHPEFDFPLAIKREISGVWRSEQGLGALSGHSDIAELPRILLLWLSSVVVPARLLRYLYFFATLLLGPLGVYLFIKEATDKKGFGGSLAAFLGALYYLLNYTTLHHYYVPLEMFATQFGLMPWIFWLILKFLNKGTRKYLILLFIISFIAAPMAWAATLFYGYFMILVLFLLAMTLVNKWKVERIKKIVSVLFIIIITNAFWLLPNAYTIIKQRQEITDSNINRLFSQEAFLVNKAYGNIENVVIHKNYLFSWREHQAEDDQFVELLDEWNLHLENNLVLPLAYMIAAIVFLGLLASIFRKDKVGISLLPVVLVSLFFIINENPPSGAIYSYLRENIAIFKEGFRMPFTKFSILLTFAFSYYLAFAKNTIWSIFSKKRGKYRLIVALLAAGLILTGIVYPMLPAFKGNLISKSMRVKIPEYYFEFFRWANGKKGRIAKFPLNTPFGWTYYNWDYEGAGFIPFGVENPTLDRDFDRWSKYNETFYNQASHALYAQDLQALERVLEKYDVTYLLLDESVTVPVGEKDVLYFETIKELLDQSERIDKKFETGPLSIYQTNFVNSLNGVWAPETYAELNTDLTYWQEDPLYENWGDYITRDGVEVFPFVNYDERERLDIRLDENKLMLRKSFDQPATVDRLILPDYFEVQDFLPIDVYLKNKSGSIYELTFKFAEPSVNAGGRNFQGNVLAVSYDFATLSGTPGFISIENSIFEVEKEMVGDVYLGSVVIPVRDDLKVSVYSSEGQDESENVTEILKETPRVCSDPTKGGKLISLDETSFEMEVEKESLCFGQGISAVRDLIAKISFDVDSKDGLFPELCFSGQDFRHCLGDDLPEAYIGRTDNLKHFEYRVPLKEGEYWTDFVGQAVETGKSSIAYKNISITSYAAISTRKLSIGKDLSLNYQKNSISINDEVDFIELVVPTGTYYQENLALGRGHPKPHNCDAFEMGSVDKIVLERSVYYQADGGGISCDYLPFSTMVYDRAYLVRIKGENKKGRSLKVYLFNWFSDKVEIEAILPTGEFDKLYPVIPKKQPGSGYTLNIETRSFGKVSSENILDEVAYLSFPYRWLSQITISQNGSGELANLILPNPVLVNKVSTNERYRYEVDVLSKRDDGLIVLSQSHEEGWQAFDLGNNPSKIERALPWIFADKLEHIRVNSWANGWLIPEGQYQIIIVFWPQYLQYLGLTLLIITFIYLLSYQGQTVDKESDRA